MIYNPNAQESERKGRNIFKTLADQIGWQVDYTDAEFCDIDLHIKCTSKDGRNIQAAGEIKNRNASAIKYPTHIIEVHKIKALLADNKNTAMFINIFGDDIFIYNVVELAKMIKHGDIKPYNKYLPDNNSSNRQFIPRLIIEVSKDLAAHFQKVNGIWKRIK